MAWWNVVESGTALKIDDRFQKAIWIGMITIDEQGDTDRLRRSNKAPMAAGKQHCGTPCGNGSIGRPARFTDRVVR
jgi:hypothetical protein